MAAVLFLCPQGSETEDQIVRYLLQVTHTFLPQKKPVMSEESGFAGEGVELSLLNNLPLDLKLTVSNQVFIHHL